MMSWPSLTSLSLVRLGETSNPSLPRKSIHHELHFRFSTLVAKCMLWQSMNDDRQSLRWSQPLIFMLQEKGE
jgi:hypothetical protein